MKTIHVSPSSLPQRSQFIRDKTGKYDLLGFIISELGCKIDPGTRTPQQLTRSVDPITVYLRQTVILTPLGYSLLYVTNLPITQQIPAANKLLLPYNITISTSPVEEAVVSQQHYDSLSIRSQVEEWLGMPVPQQYEDILAQGISLKIKPETIADMICDVM
jgi:hypothetical protein